MSKTSEKTDFNNLRRKLIYWISQWTPESNPTQEADIDISDLTIFFQIIGFKLERFEKSPDIQGNAVATPSDCESFANEIQLICSKSGMRSTLTKAIKTCQCPSRRDIEKGHLWTVTSREPSFSSQTTVYSSACSLIPTISKHKLHAASHLIQKTFAIIKDNDTQENDVNLSQNALLTRHRSLDTLKSREGPNLLNGNLTAEMSWEVDPKTTPPTQTSSPVPELIRTLSRISLDSNSKRELIKKLSTIQELTKEALQLAGVNSTSTKIIQRKRVSDIKPEGTPVMNGLRQKTPNTPRKKDGTPTRKLISSKPNKCGIPTPTFQRRIVSGAETGKSQLGMSNINKPIRSVGIPILKYRKSVIPKK